MRKSVVACLLAAGAIVASAQTNWIYQHNLVYQDPNDPNLPNLYYYYVSHGAGTVVIHHALQGEPFEFEAALLDQGGGYTGPGHVSSIAADEDAGSITITVVGHNGHDYGAANVDAVSLLDIPNAECTIAGLVTQGEIGADGPINVDRATGVWNIGDTWGSVSNDINAGCFLAQLYCGSIENVYVKDKCELEVQPDAPAPKIEVGHNVNGWIKSKMTNIVFDGVYIYGSLRGDIAFDGRLRMLLVYSMDAPSTVQVGGNMINIKVFFGPHEGTSITVDGNVKDPWFGYGWTLGGGEIGGTVHIHGDTGVGAYPDGVLGICAPLTGSITVDGDVVNSAWMPLGGTGALLVGGTVDRLDVGDDLYPPAGLAGIVDVKSVGELTVPYGDLSGQLIMRGSFGGDIEIGAAGQPPRHLTGSITALDSWTGSATITGDVHDVPQAGRAGFIRIDGAFGDGLGAGRIQVDGTLGDPNVAGRKEYVCVDYDGYDVLDRWRAGAQISVHGQAYAGNTPSAHIYETTMCKGDSNNDGYVDFGDNSAMLLAINNPPQYDYLYPGLAGSRLFHCDLGGPIEHQCDGLVNSLDFQLFRLRWGCCSDECGVVDCNSLTAGETAAVLAETVPDELQADLDMVVSEVANEHPDAPVREYWQDVQAELGQ